MPREYSFETTCVGARGKDINAMRDKARPITYRTMRQHCGDLKQVAMSLGYEHNTRKGLTLKEDGYVRYYKSTYLSRPCYFLEWSGIEHIWTKQG